jgi:NADPH2:quinone reductase
LLSAFRGNYTTAYYGLQRARLQGGETLLVNGASGGVGFAAVDLGKLFGAKVIATGGSDKKLAIVADNGADHVVNYSSGEFAEKVMALTNGRGVDVVFDPVGGAVFDESMKCLAPRARVLVVGFASGQSSTVKTHQLLIRDVEVIGYTMAALQRDDPALADRNLRQLIRWAESEHIRPYCSHYLPLANPYDALQAVCDRKVVGKAVLIS